MTRAGPLRKNPGFALFALTIAALGCSRPGDATAPHLVGQWRSSVQFKNGAFASIENLEFMFVFNLGGTMTESSNYDGAPPVPPAYGIWRNLGPREFEAKYEFYATQAPAGWEAITGGGGWLPSGRGVFVERILLSPDGRSFESTIRYEASDLQGNPIDGGGDGTGRGERLSF